MPAGEFETGNLTLAVMQVDAFGIDFSPTASRSRSTSTTSRAPRPSSSRAGSSSRGDVIDSGVCFQAFFHDPDGNMIGIHHRYAPEAD